MIMRMLGALAVGFMCAAQTAQAVLPIEVYGADPQISDVEISADGSKLAMARSVDNEAKVLIVDRVTQETQQYNFGDAKIRNVEWSSANHVIAYATQTRDFIEYGKTIFGMCTAFSIDTRKRGAPVPLLRKSKVRNGCGVESRLWTESGDVLMQLYGDLVRVNGDTGDSKSFVKAAELTSYWVTSPKGYVIARVDHAPRSNRYRVLVPTDEDRRGDWKTVFAEETEIPNLVVYGASANEQALIIGTRMKSDYIALFEMSLKDGSIGKPLFEPDGVDINGVIADPYTGAIVGASYIKDRTEQIFFQNDLQAVLLAAKGALADWQTVVLKSWGRDRKAFVVYAEGTKSAGDYFVLDRSKGRMNFLARLRPDIKPESIAQVRAFTYAARDGVKIPAYLTLPPGTDAKHLPLVVYPHGGPSDRDSMEFDYWAQAMASRGYAVLQMNFRGSEGYGEAFEAAGFGEWGGKMQDDVTDGLQHIIKEGVADPARVCIVGASYGGYAALAGAAFTPDAYKCAVALAGVTDLNRALSETIRDYGSYSTAFAYWSKSIGDRDEDKAKIAARSPINAVDKIKADVLLIHGQLDTVVPFAHSQRMYDALKKEGKSVEFVKLDGEDHHLSKPKTRTEMLKAVEGFLAKHLGGAAQPSAN
ncbi:MAG: S9 family peptidase [Rhodospirillaceae bacterium]|nr:S9 family peptidase [Rhodospirillaceae bacterium]